jgi:hypothetical protein
MLKPHELPGSTEAGRGLHFFKPFKGLSWASSELQGMWNRLESQGMSTSLRDDEAWTWRGDSHLLHRPHAAFQFCALPKLGWFKCDENGLQWLAVAGSNDTTETMCGPTSIPPTWLGPARKQLASATLAQRTALQWAVPRAELEAALSREAKTIMYSPPVYSAGAAWYLIVEVQKAKGGKHELCVYLQPCRYSHGATPVAPHVSPLACSFTISRAVPGQAQPKPVCETAAVTLFNGWGMRCVFTLASPSDLEPHLVDGCLKLTATLNPLSAVKAGRDLAGEAGKPPPVPPAPPVRPPRPQERVHYCVTGFLLLLVLVLLVLLWCRG